MGKLYRVKTLNEIVTCPDSDIIHIGISLNWYCTARKAPVLPYSDVFPKLSYELSPNQKPDVDYLHRVRAYIDQFFTGDEAIRLHDYLINTNAAKVVIEEIKIPLQDLDMSYAEVYNDNIIPKGYGFIELPQFNGYPFDYKVKGYFDTQFSSVFGRYESLSMGEISSETKNKVMDAQDIRQLVSRIRDLKSSLVNLKDVLNSFNSITSKME